MIDMIRNGVRALRPVDSGATAVEYAIMLAGIALAIVAAVAAFGIAVRNLFVIPGW